MRRLGTSREEFATWDQEKLGHTAHCIEYLRQGILCSADTTLEGETGSYSESIGWGQKHVCRDYDELMRLSNERAAWDLSHERSSPDIHKILASSSDGCTAGDGNYCH